MEPPVNRFAAAHGDYHDDTIVDLSGELGHGRQKTFTVLRNRGRTTVERWIASGALTPDQIDAIGLYLGAWMMVIGEQRTTTNWHVAGTVRGVPLTEWIDSHLRAEQILAVLDELVFKCLKPIYVDVWQNVVIHDEAAGVVGSRLGFKHKGAEASAKTVVLFIADLIAGCDWQNRMDLSFLGIRNTIDKTVHHE